MNTNVGKTVVAMGYVLKEVRAGNKVKYLKPMQTGTPTDVEKIQEVVKEMEISESVEAACCFSFKEAIAPHAAAPEPVSDEAMDAAIRGEFEGWDDGVGILETAGGVCTPMVSGLTPQADFYRRVEPLASRPELALVADGRLGGISTTLCAIESLSARGYRRPFPLLFFPTNDTPEIHLNLTSLSALTGFPCHLLPTSSSSGGGRSFWDALATSLPS